MTAMPPPAIWSALPVPALVLNVVGRITAINPAAEDFLNSSEKACVGAALPDLMRVAAPLEGAIERARDAGSALFVNDVQVAVGGRTSAECSLQIAPLGSDAAPGPGHMLILVTPRDLAGKLHGGGGDLSARSAVGMAEMLAHEIKNPLAGITGAAQLLSMGLDEEGRVLTDLIVSESRRIVSLLSQVESFGNLAPPQLRAVNIHDVLTRARRSALLGCAAEMRVIEEYDPSLPEAQADPDMLLQVLQNLMKNAAEAAGPEGGTIRLRSFFEHGVQLRGADAGGRGAAHLPLRIEVVDDGPGVPEALVGTLFDPFVSGRENGTGLGLAVAARIMEGHGGRIALLSAPGRTTFRLSLPAVNARRAR